METEGLKDFISNIKADPPSKDWFLKSLGGVPNPTQTPTIPIKNIADGHIIDDVVHAPIWTYTQSTEPSDGKNLEKITLNTLGERVDCPEKYRNAKDKKGFLLPQKLKNDHWFLVLQKKKIFLTKSQTDAFTPRPDLITKKELHSLLIKCRNSEPYYYYEPENYVSINSKKLDSKSKSSEKPMWLPNFEYMFKVYAFHNPDWHKRLVSQDEEHGDFVIIHPDVHTEITEMFPNKRNPRSNKYHKCKMPIKTNADTLTFDMIRHQGKMIGASKKQIESLSSLFAFNRQMKVLANLSKNENDNNYNNYSTFGNMIIQVANALAKGGIPQPQEIARVLNNPEKLCPGLRVPQTDSDLLCRRLQPLEGEESEETLVPILKKLHTEKVNVQNIAKMDYILHDFEDESGSLLGETEIKKKDSLKKVSLAGIN